MYVVKVEVKVELFSTLLYPYPIKLNDLSE